VDPVVERNTDSKKMKLTQVKNAANAKASETLEEILKTRTCSIAAWPMYVMAEYAYGLSIPSEVFGHPVIQELQQLAFDIIAM
jgi:hypothetical protein